VFEKYRLIDLVVGNAFRNI